MSLKIRTKLLLGFALLLALLVSLALVMMDKLSDSNDRLILLVNKSAEKVNLSNEIVIGVLDAGRHEKNILLEKSPSRQQYYKERLYTALSTIERKTEDLEKIIDDDGKAILNEFRSTWSNYKDDIYQIVLDAMQNENEKAIRLSSEKGLRVRDKALALMSKLVEKNKTIMRQDKAENTHAFLLAQQLMFWLISASIVFTILISYWIVKSITNRIASITTDAQKIASREFSDEHRLGEEVQDELRPVVLSLANINESFREVTRHANSVASGDFIDDLTPKSERDVLGHALKKMASSLRATTAANEKHNWLTGGKNKLNQQLFGDFDVEVLSSRAIELLCTYINAQIGAVYVLNDHEYGWVLTGSYAFGSVSEVKHKFDLHEGLIGQAAHEQKPVSLPGINAGLRITSSFLNAKPVQLYIVPFIFEGKTLGVIEIGRLTPFTTDEIEFINDSMENIAISMHSAMSRARIQQLLEETQVQSEELQSQQEELRQVNEELEEQAQSLKQQQEELQMTNEELEEQTQSLELKNREVEQARFEIEQKSRQLEVSSQYKSQFLANMSHELRTPLNSLLILSKDLAENKKKNLDSDQVESAEIIHKSGNELLTLINEVLDLSKIEAGKMSVNVERIPLKSFMEALMRDFKPGAEQKGLSFELTMGTGLPAAIRTDAQRLGQILKNLLSNAIKFTSRGKISVGVHTYSGNQLIISVADTGIGIPEEKQSSVFEAFQQADGSTSRKYGGTGLGLSISRQMARLLKGEITLSSEPNKGSIFSVLIPFEISNEAELTGQNQVIHEPPPIVDFHENSSSSFINYPALDDDRHTIKLSDKTVLIIEDDLNFATILSKQAKQKGFKFLSASTGEDGLALAKKYKPNAIILDMDLPGMHGKKVLHILKETPSIRHIPVHIISVNERSLIPIKEGAVEYLVKPVGKHELEEAFNRIENFVNRKMRNLLIVEDDENSRTAMRKLIGNGDVHCFEAGTGKQALEVYTKNHIDCIVLDIGLPDISGFELIYKLENAKETPIPPIIIYTGRELTREENAELQKYADSIIIKGVKSEERLLDETALFLHRTISSLPESKQHIIHKLYDKEAIFQSKKILVVDDDMRNVFALSKVLKERGMEVLKADTGKTALEMLDRHSGIDLVLMDIMMPEMDGYEAMRLIRAQARFKNLPIIALTAKAMKDDKQKCMDAGANDYASKPVDVERLLMLMRLWLSK